MNVTLLLLPNVRNAMAFAEAVRAVLRVANDDTDRSDRFYSISLGADDG